MSALQRVGKEHGDGQRAHAAGKRICFDPNYRNLMGGSYRPRMEKLAGLADFIKVSEEDLGLMFPGDGLELACCHQSRTGSDPSTIFTLLWRKYSFRSAFIILPRWS